MSPEEKEELLRKLDETKKTIQELRNSLNLIDAQKEEWFTKKEAVGKEIVSLIESAKKSKVLRNVLTDSVKKSKEERMHFAEGIRSRLEEMKHLRDERQDVIKKKNIDRDPSLIKGEIERMEYTLETNVMSFEKEQKLMKTIRDLRKKYDEVKDIGAVNDKIRVLNKEVKDFKRQAEDKHREVQDAAKKSQEFHENVLASGTKIEEQKKQEEEAYKKFMEYKQQFNDVNSQLKEQLVVLNDLNQKLNLVKEEGKKEKKKSIESVLKSKEESVQEKIRTGKKLTTEDLLILQRSEDEIF